jgi:hypothetical protein
MLTIPSLLLAQSIAQPIAPILRPRVISQPQEVRPLPGQLNQIPVFNSNSPEVFSQNGILLSTFAKTGKAFPEAHLNYPLSGRFDIFLHHIARAEQEFARPFYLGVILHNPTSQAVTVDIMQAVIHTTNPGAPFVYQPDYADNGNGTIFSGPGSRLSTDILRGVHQSRFPDQLIILPGENRILLNESVLIGSGISGLIRLRSTGQVHVASLAMRAPIAEAAPELLRPPEPTPTPSPTPIRVEPAYRTPTSIEWESLLRNGNLVTPRDLPPTPPGSVVEDVIYGRVAGVAVGNQWQAQLVDNTLSQELTIPRPGGAVSYVINTLNQGTFGTRQDQSAPMLVRYPDTAYRANGNYGVQYSLSLPLYNNTNRTQQVTVSLQTPMKRDDNQQGLLFLEPPLSEVFFRGTVQVAFQDDFGLPRTRLVHVIQRQGQQGEPLVSLRMSPGSRRLVNVDLIYPPDATPPQVLTVRTMPSLTSDRPEPQLGDSTNPPTTNSSEILVTPRQ